jgi:hypothetical protein
MKFSLAYNKTVLTLKMTYVCHEFWRYANLLSIPTSEFRMTMMLEILMDEI